MKVERTIRIESEDDAFKRLLREVLEKAAAYIVFYDRQTLMRFLDPIQLFDAYRVTQAAGICDEMRAQLERVRIQNKMNGAPSVIDEMLKSHIMNFEKLHLYFVEMRNLIGQEEKYDTNSAGK